MSSSRRVGHQGSATAVMELEPVHSLPQTPEKHFPVESGRRLGQNVFNDNRERHDQNETLPSPTVASHDVLERWNFPKSNLYRTCAAFIGFAIMGMNDATYGAIIPYVRPVSACSNESRMLTCTSWKHITISPTLSCHLFSSVLLSVTTSRPC